MNEFEKKYYEHSELWDYDYLSKPDERSRAEAVFKNIPDDTKDILDVGCGNGSFLNFLKRKNKYKKLVGLDSSKEALKYVKTEKIEGTATKLPFKDNSFDLVTCLEVLEHLSWQDFKDAIKEMQRVSRKYIVVTVPNSEDIRLSLVECPACHCRFNIHFHVRSFTEEKLKILFNNFKNTKVKSVGPKKKQRRYNKFLLNYFIALRKTTMPKNSICPQCGYQIEETQKKIKRTSNIFSVSKKIIKYLNPADKKGKWLLAVYVKK